ncbi:VOC family protein [Rhodococcus spongiicola]|uniref:VOC family protein n=1 Tax=Rhodococcus spongiicola TaxID=2487352 RepID=A0A3S3AEC5_9NOCA|nr:VOC family protein [Rhodococcus spongiicola]RVW02615.1 VOC family protein [Rhodococcus spongiicola]
MSERSSYTVGTPSWVDLQTPDQLGAKDFYADVFGWSYHDLSNPDGSVYSIAMLRGERVAAIAPLPPGSSPVDTPPTWNTFITVDDVDAATARVAPAGGKLILQAFDVGDAGRMAFVADPTGAEVGLWQAREHVGATLVNETGTLIWNELVTDRPETALAFYESVVGLGSAPMPGPGHYTVLQVNGDGVGGCAKPPRPEVPNHWHVYFSVDETDAAVENIIAKGGALMADPYDLPRLGRMAVLSDPQGAVFSVMQSEPAP